MSEDIPPKISSLLKLRSQVRQSGDYRAADRIRKQIESVGWQIIDTPEKTSVIKTQSQLSTFLPKREIGLVAVFGSGEMSSTGRKIHEYLLRDFLPPVHIALLETPTGYEDNPHIWYKKMETYMSAGLKNYHPLIVRIEALRRSGSHNTNDSGILSPILSSHYIHMGAGSPSYVIHHLKNTVAYTYIGNQLKNGASVSFASAAAVAMGRYAIPVYEIYFAGHDPKWLDGLDFFSQFHLNISFIPHWNNIEGGREIDTRFAYMGKKRLDKLMTIIPGETTCIGLDEHTALVFNIAKSQALVMGKGTVTLYKPDKRRIYQSGKEIYFSDIQSMKFKP